MIYDQTVRNLYKKLLTLYPREFRERMGESMEQTFYDLYSEWRRHKKRDSFRFVLWLFVDIALGIINERVLLIKQGGTMKTAIKSLGLAGLISFILVLPFTILETLNNEITKQNALGLILLFGVLWLLPTLFIVTLMPIVRTVRLGNSLMAKPAILFFRGIFLAVIGTVWVWGLLDQLPCFLGVPNCD